MSLFRPIEMCVSICVAYGTFMPAPTIPRRAIAKLIASSLKLMSLFHVINMRKGKRSKKEFEPVKMDKGNCFA